MIGVVRVVRSGDAVIGDIVGGEGVRSGDAVTV